MKAVLISIQPKWVEKIANGKKTIEVRKTTPKQVPFKCYIYCSKGNANEIVLLKNYKNRFIFGDYRNADGHFYTIANGKVIGEFVCDKVIKTCGWRLRGDTQQCAKRTTDEESFPELACLTIDEIVKYAGSENREVCGWHISDLKIYDKPKELSEFKKTKERIAITCGMQAGNGLCRAIDYEELCDNIKCCFKTPCPPQSWCYVEEIEE